MRRRKNDTVTLLNEAEALERLGSTWTQAHAAAFDGCSVATIRRSDCPKHLEEGKGIEGKPRVIYVPAEVRAWKMNRRLPQVA